MSDVLFESATCVAAMIKRREISSRELTGMLLARVAERNPTLNAIIELRAEGVLSDASKADEALARGEHAGPLHGVPITIKDAFDVAGLRTTWGNRQFGDCIASSDAVAVARLKAAGALVVGKTNVAFMLADFGQTTNELYGRTVNPWDVNRTPGGSSGGASAALAAGLTFLDFGSDLAGSIRIPASLCGVYGLKPSAEIVPVTGFQPPGPSAPPNAMTFMNALGPLARSATDLRTALTATAGAESPAADACSWSLPAPRHTRLKDFRVGVVLDDPNAPVTDDVASQLADLVDALARGGASIHTGWPDGVDPAAVHQTFGFHVQTFFDFLEPETSETTLSEFVLRERHRIAVGAAWQRYFEEVDVLLCPATFTTAFPHDTRPVEQRTIPTAAGDRPYTDLSFWTSHASLPGLPAVSAPIASTQAGLPIGVQIIGPRYHDDTPITFAELLTTLTGGMNDPLPGPA